MVADTPVRNRDEDETPGLPVSGRWFSCDNAPRLEVPMPRGFSVLAFVVPLLIGYLALWSAPPTLDRSISNSSAPWWSLPWSSG